MQPHRPDTTGHPDRSNARRSNAEPREFADALRSLYPAPAVPREREAAILAAARAHWTGRTATSARTVDGSGVGWLGAGWRGVGAAAALLLLALVIDWGPLNRSVALDGDRDENGRLDIVDVYRVALDLERGNSPPSDDLDGDGEVDAADLDELLRRAVHLESLPPPRKGGQR